MKKLISLLLALTLVFGLAVSAAAVEGEEGGDGGNENPPEVTYTDVSTVTIPVHYTKVGSTTASSPETTFTFVISADTSTSNAPLPTLDSDSTPQSTTLTFAAGAAGDTTNGTQNLTVNLPTIGANGYTTVGVYKYVIKPNDTTKKAGVKYHSGDIYLTVTVIEGENGKLRIGAVHADGSWESTPNNGKTGDITETYSAGSLVVNKYVSGNMADKDTQFDVKIKVKKSDNNLTYPATFTVTSSGMTAVTDNPTSVAPDAELSCKIMHNGTIQIDNIPYDMTVEVTENAPDGYNPVKYDVADTTSYTAKSYDTMTTNPLTGENNKIQADTKVVGIYNNKGAIVDTGVVLDNAPYLVLLAVAVIGLAVVIVKKRHARDY